ncbi:MAG: ABC transporter ATP-binding protein [Candidatus Methanomethylicia archaeon]
MVSVKLEHLTKFFGKVVAVDDLNLEINDGEFVTLLGPSGCGKTTTLLIIAGIYKPTKGYVYFDEKIVNDLPPKDRNIGMVFQSYALYPHMNVFDNIAFPLKLKKIPKVEIEARVKKIADFLEIRELLDRKPTQLSGGQQQRVALARALVKEPTLFLMDEPLSNLDAKLRVIMRTELKKLQKKLKITTIYVTHDQIEAMTMADRVAVMNMGKLQQYSNVTELYNNPKNLFVAGFIGSPPTNFFDCTLVEKNGKYYLNTSVFTIELPVELGKVIAQKSTGPELIIGIRPEDLIVRLKPNEKTIECKVYEVEPVGRDIIVNIRFGDMLAKAIVSSDLKLSVGDNIWLSYDLNKLHIFDKKTGEVIL